MAHECRLFRPRSSRHTKGMHMLQSVISLDMIRDFLGHVDVKTTHIYARANLEMKRQDLEKMTDPSPVLTIPSWQQNKDLLSWLGSIAKIQRPLTMLDYRSYAAIPNSLSTNLI
jgi:hypothetical protein